MEHAMMEQTIQKTLLALALAGLSGTAMARGDIEILARTCNNCHGVGGISAGASMPSIGGLPKEYLGRIMKQWKYDERTGVTMPRIVKGFSDDEIDALAAYFAAQRWVPVPQAASSDLLAKGKSVVSDNCEDCHGAAGNDPDVDAPRINGQWAKYMGLEIEKYRSAEFKMPHRRMKKAVNSATPADATAAARYFGAQGK
jgi:sulfide dehydrogenase cytochrome subunit